jgi:hypothetical protein
MKRLLTPLAFFTTTIACAQFEITSGVAVNRNDAVGFPIHLAYDFKIKDRLYTKSQVGYKSLHTYDEFVGANLTVDSWEFHQTVSYEAIRKKKYILKPNVEINYRFYHWKGKLDPPYNSFPGRAWVIGVRDGNFVLNSFDNRYENEYRTNNLGLRSKSKINST